MTEENTTKMYKNTTIIVNNCQDITDKDLNFKQQLDPYCTSYHTQTTIWEIITICSLLQFCYMML